MANLVSPGVSVTITDESFFIPATAPTVPLIFVATADEKLQPDNVTPAAGTYEYDVIRTVTSLKQSLELYGVPRFLEDTNGNAHHGDARNEYGLFALNQFLGVGNKAYVIRANVNLNDDLTDLRTMWESKIGKAAYFLENLIEVYMTEYNASNNYIPGSQSQGYQEVGFGTTPVTGTTLVGLPAATYNFTVTVVGGAPQVIPVVLTGGENFTALLGLINGVLVGAQASIVAGRLRITSNSFGPTSTILIVDGPATNFFGSLTAPLIPVTIYPAVDGEDLYKITVTGTELTSLVEEALGVGAATGIFDSFSFKNTETDFMSDHTLTPLNVYENGYSNPPTGTFIGFAGLVADWILTGSGSTPGFEDEWTPTEASGLLFAAADGFKYTQEFLNETSLGANDAARRTAIVTALSASINGNADIRSENYEYNLVLCPGFPEVVDELLSLVVDIGEEAFVIADTPFDKDPAATVAWAGTTSRQSSTNVAYYYPHGLASNIDGKTVMCAASGIALRTYAYSDNVSELWFAPAGTRRGLVTGISLVGHVSGTLGVPTTFVETNLNVGQRDDLYKYFTNVNPIAFFPGRGILIWGQKTSAPDASALDRVNVSRLVKYIKRQLRKNTMSFVFQPNDQLTRDDLKATVDAFLGDLIVKRGLYDFATVCDESNNTPDRIDRNEMYIDVAIKPVKAAEFIYIPIRIVATGTEI